MTKYSRLIDHNYFNWLMDMGLIETAIIEFPRYARIIWKLKRIGG